MKTLFKYCLTLLIPAVLIFGCGKNPKTEVDNTYCYHGDSITKQYYKDAQSILYYGIYMDSAAHPDYFNPYFDTVKINSHLDKIQAVKNLNIPEADSIFNIHKVHTINWISANNFLLELDLAASETQKIKLGQATCNTLFDSLQSTFGFQYQSISAYGWANFTTNRDFNLLPIIRWLQSVPFVLNGEIGGYIGDGSNIEINQSGTTSTVDFSIGWGDCLAGCIYHRHWIFEVDKNCKATFIRPLPINPFQRPLILIF